MNIMQILFNYLYDAFNNKKRFCVNKIYILSTIN